jgi:transposase
VARRFRCEADLCGRRIFTERFEDGVLAPWARRTGRSYTLSITSGALLAAARRRPISLLPAREPATAQAWLAGQPQITFVARDGGGSYTLAAAKALPHAAQVADRWHLMDNASHAFLDAVRKSMRQVRAAIGAAERSQYKGYLRREETNAAIVKQAEAGASINEVVRLTGHSRGLVRRVLRGQRSDVFRVRESSLEHHLPRLDAQWGAGHYNGADQWRRLNVLGFRGSVRVVTEWATRRWRAEKADTETHNIRAPNTIIHDS